MNRELALAVAALMVVVGALTTLALAGAVSDPGDPATAAEVEDDGRVSLAELTIGAEEVTGGTAALVVDTHLDHRGPPVSNVSVVHRVTDTNTGLVEETVERDVETLDEEAETVVSSSVAVPRESSYEIETFVYRDGTRTESASHSVEGVDDLTPAYADTDVEFHSFGGGALGDVPAIEYTLASTTDDRATLDVASHLTNTGDDPEADLELEVKARQSDSSVVADAATVELSAIEAGETIAPDLELDVPQEYDYYLDAVLWRDGTIVETDRSVANLGGGSLSADGATGDDGLEVSDFAGSSADGAADADRDGDAENSTDDTSGFGVTVAALAVLLGTITLVRRHR